MSHSSSGRYLWSRMLLLSEQDVRKCLSMKDCVDVNRKALASLRPDGGGHVPTRLGLPYPSNDNSTVGGARDWSLFKPASYYQAPPPDDDNNNNSIQNDDSHIMGMKLVSVRRENPSKGLPLVPATILLLDAATGVVQAVLGGTYLTGARTAAGSAVATELVVASRSKTTTTKQQQVRRVVVFGAGMQASCHVEALRCVQPSISKVTIVNRSRERAEGLAQELEELETNIVLLQDTEKVQLALAEADVVVTCTNTTTPLFDGSWLKPGCHVNGVGSYTPDMQEVDRATVARSRVLVDTPEALQVGDLKHLQQDITNTQEGEAHPCTLLASVLEDPSWLLQYDNDVDSKVDCTFYKAVGTAVQDIMTAKLVVDRAREMGIGTEVDMM